jgi:molybdate transport system ATP-binding protein
VSTLALDVSLRRGAQALVVSEAIPLGGITAIFGPSGAGKTTLLRIICGLEPQAEGRVALDDEVWQDARRRLPTHRRRVGFVFQDSRLFAHLDVAGNLRFALRHRRHDGPITLSDVVAALDLQPLLQRRAGQLSGGERQRVAIGRALLTNPRLLLMDEPLSSLDAQRKREVLRYVEQLPSRFDLPVLYVTHSIDEVGFLADRVLLIGNGKALAHGNVEDVLEDIRSWALTGRAEGGSMLRAVVEEHRGGLTTVAVDGQHLRVPQLDAAPGTGTRLRIKARDVVIAMERPQRLSIRNVLAGRVMRIDVDETIYVEVLLDVGGQHLRARITRDALEELRLKTGQTVFALIKSAVLDDPFLR